MGLSVVEVVLTIRESNLKCFLEEFARRVASFSQTLKEETSLMKEDVKGRASLNEANSLSFDEARKAGKRMV